MGNLGEPRGGMGKSGMLEHKSGNSLSLKRAEIEETLLWTGGPIGTHQRSFKRYRHQLLRPHSQFH